MARTLEQILGELGSVYDPQINNIRTQQSLIPEQVANEEKALGAKQVQAFDDILGGARRRGIGFSGIPLSEQAKYTSTEFLPAITRLKMDARKQATSLEDAILGINERRTTNALGLRQQDVDNDYRNQMFEFEKQKFGEQLAEQRRQAAAAAGGGFSPSFGGGAPAGPAPKMQARGGGGFNFTDAGGKAISAAKYAQLTGQDLMSLLQGMGQAGDRFAAQAWYQLSKTKNNTAFNNAKKQYQTLFWGT